MGNLEVDSDPDITPHV